MRKDVLFVVVSFLVGFSMTVCASVFVRSPGKIISPLSLISFSLNTPPSQGLHGEISHISGGVLWQSRSAQEPILITQPQKLQQGEEVDTGNTGAATINFPNSLSVILSQNTQLSIIQTLPINVVFGQKTETVKYQSGSSHVSVRGLDLLITLAPSSTVYVVMQKDITLSLSVASGSATIAYTDTHNVSQVQIISSGKRMTFNNNTKTVSF